MRSQAPAWWWTPNGRPLWPASAACAWPILRLAEGLYRRAVAHRNGSYEKRARDEELFRPPIPTISVGNITVGGSGKTPLAIYLADLLHARDLKPAILARGYGAVAGSLNDEMFLEARKCPYAAVLADPDRMASINKAVTSEGAQVAILDDAFQHRKVCRDLDIVLVDATRGFGNGHLLPAGPLREPVASLCRADLVLLTRTDQVLPERLESITRQIADQARCDLPVGHISFQPAGLADVQFAPADAIRGPCGVFAGIGNFQAFIQTCRWGGLDVCAQMPLADHVGYDQALCSRIRHWATTSRVRSLVTTEKDATKLSRIDWSWPVPIRVLAIKAVPDAGTTALLAAGLDRIMRR